MNSDKGTISAEKHDSQRFDSRTMSPMIHVILKSLKRQIYNKQGEVRRYLSYLQSYMSDTFDLSICYTVILALVPLVVDFREHQFNIDDNSI